MAFGNKRKTSKSPTPRQRRFGDKIALHHCNDEKKLARKKASKTITNGKAKFMGRKRKVSSPSLKENHCAVAVLTTNTCDSLQVGVGQLTALRCQPRLTDERVDVEVYIKRHEKLEKEEKQILRRDRIWQNEVRRRSRLLRIQQSPPRERDFRIVVLRKLNRYYK